MKQFSYKTNSKKVLGDMHTPVSIYLKVRFIPSVGTDGNSDYHAEKTVYRSLHCVLMASVGINNGKATMTYPDNTTEEKIIRLYCRNGSQSLYL